jgi:hypothetical protein
LAVELATKAVQGLHGDGAATCLLNGAERAPSRRLLGNYITLV